MGNRKKAEELIYKLIKEIDPSGINEKLYRDTIPEMSNEEFDKLMEEFKTKKNYLHVLDPNGHKGVKITIENNKRLLSKYNIPVYEKLIIEDEDGEKFIPNHKYNVMLLPIGRLTQHQSTGMGVAKHNLKRNPLTNQVTNESKAGSITLPEIYIFNGLGLNNILDELLGPRAGNLRSLRMMETNLEENGIHHMKDVRGHNVTGATQTLKNYFKSLHLELK